MICRPKSSRPTWRASARCNRASTQSSPRRPMRSTRRAPRTPTWRRATVRGPLHGVPFTVKDVFETSGFATEVDTPHPSTQRARRRRHRRRPHAAGRRQSCSPRPTARRTAHGRDTENVHQRAHAQPVRPLAHARRQQRRRGGPHRRGRLARRPGQRPEWRRACACALLRRGRHQADHRARAQHGRLQPARRADRPAYRRSDLWRGQWRTWRWCCL